MRGEKEREVGNRGRAVARLSVRTAPARRVPGGRRVHQQDKARELGDQVVAIAEASGLAIKALRYSVETAAGSVEILSADKASGHAAGFDLAIVDEGDYTGN